jgi:hypothetical protein
LTNGMPDTVEKQKVLWRLKPNFEQSCNTEQQLRDVPANLGDILQQHLINR